MSSKSISIVPNESLSGTLLLAANKKDAADVTLQGQHQQHQTNSSPHKKNENLFSLE